VSPEPLNGTFPLLSLLIWLPILAGVVTLAIGNARPNAARWFAVAASIVVLALTIPLFTGFDLANPGMQFEEARYWIASYDIQYHVGVDGISAALIALTTFTSVLVLIGAWGSVEQRVSDETIAGLLARQGVRIARRTVAKYRDQLDIAPARARQRPAAALAR